MRYSFDTRLAVTSICLEGLLRVAAEHLGTSHTAQRTSEHEQFEIWLKSKPNGHSEHFLKRLEGCVGNFKRLGANDILHDWVNRKVVGVTKEDMEFRLHRSLAINSSAIDLILHVQYDPNHSRGGRI